MRFRAWSNPEVLCQHKMLAEERKAVASGRNRASDGPLFGIALSGGGIRSATFCLGALQRLASADLLRHFDYMSTVSGGGYIGSSVQWWWRRRPEYDTSSRFPYGTALVASSSTEHPLLNFLRWHASYLAPGGGISIWSGIAVVLRTLILSLLVWLPVAVAAMFALHTLGAALYLLNLQQPSQWNVSIPLIDGELPAFAAVAVVLALATVGLFVMAATFLAIASILVPPETMDNRGERVARAAKCVVLGFAVGGIGMFLLVQFSKFTTVDRFISELDFQSQVAWIIAILLAAFGVVALVTAILQLTRRLEFGVNYSLRRRFESGATVLFAVLLPLIILASLPLVEVFLRDKIADKDGPFLGLIAVASGVVSGLYGHFVQAQRIAPKYASRWIATLAAGVFIYSMLFAAYFGASFLLNPNNYHADPVVARWCQIAFPALLCFSLSFGWFSNLNSLGLHRFYRDRLMEAFLPTDPTVHAGAPGYTDADRILLSDLWPQQEGKSVERPYPLMNANAIMIHDTDPNTALRGGDNFLLSPLFVGSKATGWARTVEHGKQHGSLTLASAMAASGAAANANAAYIGTGITRDRLTSIVMMLLNMRLGLWLGTPGTRSGRPNYFSPGFKYGILRSGYKREANFTELTDGGHFDNLGVYELIRRQADVIFVLDSEEDPSTSMTALASVCQRVQEDFDTTIEIGDKADKIAPGIDLGYPPGAKYSDKSYFVAKITYRPLRCSCGCGDEAHKTGVFVYIKSNMIKGLSFPARGYKAKNPDFPNQSTMDQFFEPAQFEAYRELGYTSVDSLLRAVKLVNSDPKQVYATLAATAVS